jgi:hypothetical protein
MHLLALAARAIELRQRARRGARAAESDSLLMS